MGDIANVVSPDTGGNHSTLANNGGPNLVQNQTLHSQHTIEQNVFATNQVFTQDQLRQTLRPIIERLYRLDPESLPFRQPVDPTLLQIPDYFDIIKKPMDLSTIKKKLDTGQYLDPWQFADDIRLMLENGWLYNRSTSRVYRYCTKLSDVFESEIESVVLNVCSAHH